GADGLLRQVVFIVARLGALGGAAAAALVGAARADAGVAGALLAEQLPGAARDLTAAQRGVRAGALVREVHQHDLVQELLVDLAAELGGVNLHRANGLPLGVENVQSHLARWGPFGCSHGNHPFTANNRGPRPGAGLARAAGPGW